MRRCSQQERVIRSGFYLRSSVSSADNFFANNHQEWPAMARLEGRVALSICTLLLLSSATRAQAVYDVCSCMPAVYYYVDPQWFYGWDYYPTAIADTPLAPTPPPREASRRKPRVMPLAAEEPPLPATKKAEDKVAPPAFEKRAPRVTESRQPGLQAPRPATEARCQVGFWNLSAHDVTLTVDGRPRMLPKDRAITLELPYRFVWQVDQRPAQTEQIPVGQTAHEVVIRD
jgi:hypothetical protein